MDCNAENLEAKIEKFRKYYFKGAGNLLFDIFIAAEAVLKFPDLRSKALEDIKKLQNSYFQNYPKVNFDEIRGDDDFTPLFVIKNLNCKFESKINEFVKEPSKNSKNEIRDYMVTIMHVSYLYRNSFKQALNEIRKIPRYENYNVSIIDWKGQKWTANCI